MTARDFGTTKNTICVSPSTAKTLYKYLVRHGVDKEKVKATLGYSLKDLEALDLRLPIRNYHALWDLALKSSGNPALGLDLGEEPNDDDMGLLGHIFFNNATLEKALKQYERYYSIVNEGMRIELKTDDDYVYINYICLDPSAYCIPDMDRTLAVSVHRAKDHISASLKIAYVAFQHPPPSYLEEYNKVFPCPIRFNQPNSCLVFEKRFLSYRLPNRSSYLHTVLTRHIESLFKKIRPSQTLADKVRKTVENKLAKDCVDAEHIAEKLHMSRNTLYRKLKKEGISFHDLVDEVRQRKAIEYLDEGKHSLSDIAFLLGFSELSSFSRAFKRWTGTSPVKYLDQKGR